MRRLAGQAARRLWVVLHRLCAIALALLVVAAAAGAVLAWRLSEGPIEIPWLAARIDAAFNQGREQTRLQIGSSALAWEGFRNGLNSPVDIRLGDVSLLDADGATRFAIPRARITLSLAGLLAGRIEPREIVLERPELVAERAPDGTLSLLGGPPGVPATKAGPEPAHDPVAIVAELASPPATDASSGRSGDLSQLRRVRIDDATLSLIDRRLGVTWQAREADFDLAREKQGGVQGQMSLVLALGDHRAPLSGSIRLAPGGTETTLSVRLPPVAPASWADAAPILAPLGGIDAPVGGEAEATIGPHLAVRRMRLDIQAGAGTVRVADGTVPIEQAAIVASGTPERMVLDTGRLVLPDVPGSPASSVEISGTVRREGGQIEASLALGIDKVSFAALSRIWPAGLAVGARTWVVQNVTAGTAHTGHFDFTLTTPGDLSGLALTGASGTLEGEGLTVHWLRPMPPVVQARAILHLIDPDTLEIAVPSAESAPESPGGESLAVRGLRMRIAGLMQHEQMAEIKTELVGSMPAAIALLRDPRLSLLSRHPMALNDPAGQVDAKLTVSLPLNWQVSMSQIAIAAEAHLRGVHLGDIVAGHDLDQGTLDLSAGNDGLTLGGTAVLAGIPVQLHASMDFRAGPPDGVVQRIGVSGRADARQLAAAGLDAGGLLAGPVPLSVELTERRNGAGAAEVKADLTPATLSLEALGWRKAAGRPASATATVVLDHDRLGRIDPIHIGGAGLEIDGRAEFAQGRLTTLQADRLRLDRTDAQGTVRFPVGAGPITANLSGAVLDLSGRFGQTGGPNGAAAAARTPAAARRPGPSWTADARFGRVLMAGGEALTDLTAHVADDGQVVRDLRLDGFIPRQDPVRLEIRSDGARRVLTASAADAGALLRALDAIDSMQGGRLTISAAYEDTSPGHPLDGTAEIDEFSVRNAPVFGKLLQAVTLYGLVQALQGPGLEFRKLVAPFHWREGILTLDDARAFSPSLGVTAKGSFDLNAQRVDLQGTIVPAYFFNSLLGRVPIVGRLFSPEQGGGLIAGSYSLQGPIDNPNVVVNPLTALTPGFLRGLFGLF